MTTTIMRFAQLQLYLLTALLFELRLCFVLPFLLRHWDIDALVLHGSEEVSTPLHTDSKFNSSSSIVFSIVSFTFSSSFLPSGAVRLS